MLLALLGVVLIVAYPYLNPSTDEATGEQERLAAVAEAVALLEKVQSISLDFGILESSEFDYLRDETTPLLNLPVGRVNPFAPVK